MQVLQKEIPQNPGVYLLKDIEDKIIYIGKAKNLKKRVSSYYKQKDHDQKTKELLKEIKDIDFIITDNEVEALILESRLIKQHKPKYNIELKQGERYAYIKITNEKFPRILTARKLDRQGKFYGPYTFGTQRGITVRAINKIFKIRTCKKLPKKECLLYHIGQCTAPCIAAISKEDYNKNVENAKLLLEGKSKDLINNMRLEMKDASDKLQFEHARVIRDQINAIYQISGQQQIIELIKTYDQDVIAISSSSKKQTITLFNIKRGVITKKRDFAFEGYQEDLLDSFIKGYYTKDNIPSEIIVSHLPYDLAIPTYLQEISSKKITLNVPKKGDKLKLLRLAQKNAYLNQNQQSALQELQDRLKLLEYPSTIECFDISTIQGVATVGSMVYFKEQKQVKSNYRRFEIKTVQAQDDFASIAEIVRRRYTRLLEEKKELPNLIIIDGGKGQLHAALKEIEKLNIQIDIIALAKKLEEIYIPGLSHSILLEENSKALLLLKKIRDEAHRFAISYHRLKRSKKALSKPINTTIQ